MKKKILIFTVLFSLIMLSACSNKNSEKTSADKVLKVAVSEDATTMDPIEVNDDYAENLVVQVYDTLVERAPDGTMKNALAESIEVSDPQTYTIKLREGIKFSNGDPLTLDDVIFTLNRAGDSDIFKSFYGKIDRNSYEKVDDRTLKFKLTEPDATFLNALSHPGVSIVSKKYVEAGNDMNTKPMGTGPFKLDEWNQNDVSKFSVNENYWGEAPKISGIEYRVIPEASQRVIELQSGGVDMAYKVEPTDFKTVEEDENLELYKKMDNSVHFVGFNIGKAPFNNVKAREAIVNAIDVESIFETAYEKSGQIATSPINPNFEYSKADKMPKQTHDKEKAKAKLTEAGLVEGTNLSIYISDNTQRVNVATMMQAQLKEYGINLDIKRLEWGAFTDALKNKEHNMFIMSWNPSIVDAHYELYQPFSSVNKGHGPNYMYYGNEQLDNLINEAKMTLDTNKRAEIYSKAQDLINSEYPWLYLVYGQTVVGANKRVKGFEISPKYPQVLSNVSLED